MNEAALRAFGLEDLLTQPYNGYANHLICAGCGDEFGSNRKQMPGKRMWCQNCRASGKPAAQRARDFRERKAK